MPVSRWGDLSWNSTWLMTLPVMELNPIPACDNLARHLKTKLELDLMQP